ncbi:MAG: 4-alpha-glucanotransferase [Pseudomonadota bacterium]
MSTAVIEVEPAGKAMSPLAGRRSAGVCMHLSSLPGPHGIGGIGSGARKFVDTLESMGLSVWQFLPTGPTAYGDSPYQSLSTFAGNELLIGVEELIQLGLVNAGEAEPLRDLPSGFVDYGALIPIKTLLLALAADRFEDRASAELKLKCDEFVSENDQLWLHDYALYRILKNRHQLAPWTQWEPEFLRREPQALRRIELENADEIAAIKVTQFLFDYQWQALREHAARRGVALFGDMPIYIAHDSADAWAHPELLQVDALGRPQQVAGVPPDYFSEDGQLWGNPLYDWDHHARTGYRWWIDRIRQTMKAVDLVRIDHFRGFEAYWSVPAGADSARGGCWVKGPGDEVFNAMRQTLGNLPIIAEDLGVITTEVDELRKRQNIPGMKVLQFMVGEADMDRSEIVEDCVCYTGTHDNDTVVGWFNGGPGDIRTPEEIEASRVAVLANTGGRPDSIHEDLINFAYSSPAAIALAPMQDYLGLGSESRMNTPGTASSNWRWRLQPGQLSPELMQAVAARVTATGRR